MVIERRFLRTKMMGGGHHEGTSERHVSRRSVSFLRRDDVPECCGPRPAADRSGETLGCEDCTVSAGTTCSSGHGGGGRVHGPALGGTARQPGNYEPAADG